MTTFTTTILMSDWRKETASCDTEEVMAAVAKPHKDPLGHLLSRISNAVGGDYQAIETFLEEQCRKGVVIRQRPYRGMYRYRLANEG